MPVGAVFRSILICVVQAALVISVRPLAHVERARQHESTDEPIGWKEGKSHVFSGIEKVYLNAGDPMGELMHIGLTFLRENISVDNFFSVVGSFDALHYLVTMKPRKNIVFFDMNPVAIKWARMKLELLLKSNTPEDYISHLFARNLTQFATKAGQRLTPVNQEQYVSQPVEEDLRQATVASLTEESAQMFNKVLVPYQNGREEHSSWYTTGVMRPCEDRYKRSCQLRSKLGSTPHQGGDTDWSYRYGDGFLSNQHTFEAVKDVLLKVPVSWVQVNDFPNWVPSCCVDGNTAINVMDMFSNGFAHKWSEDHTHQWAHDGGSLFLIQTMTANRGELLQRFDAPASKWVQLSEWKSDSLMPTLVCEGDGGPNGCCGDRKFDAAQASEFKWLPDAVYNNLLVPTNANSNRQFMARELQAVQP